jgi:hypothetical protein
VTSFFIAPLDFALPQSKEQRPSLRCKGDKQMRQVLPNAPSTSLEFAQAPLATPTSFLKTIAPRATILHTDEK